MDDVFSIQDPHFWALSRCSIFHSQYPVHQPANGRRFSSLIAAERRFAKRPSAAMNEEKRLPFAGYLFTCPGIFENGDVFPRPHLAYSKCFRPHENAKTMEIHALYGVWHHRIRKPPFSSVHTKRSKWLCDETSIILSLGSSVSVFKRAVYLFCYLQFMKTFCLSYSCIQHCLDWNIATACSSHRRHTQNSQPDASHLHGGMTQLVLASFFINLP